MDEDLDEGLVDEVDLAEDLDEDLDDDVGSLLREAIIAATFSSNDAIVGADQPLLNPGGFGVYLLGKGGDVERI